MRTRNVAYGSLATALMSVVTLLAGLIIPRQIILAFGSDLNGISNSITQFISYFDLLEAGLAGSAVYALYKPLSEKNQTATNGILAASKHYYEKISIYYLIGITVFSAIFAQRNTHVMPAIEVFLLSMAIGIGGVLQFSTMSRYRVLLTAAQKTYILALATTASIVAKIVVVYIGLALNGDIIVVKLLVSLTILVRSVILIIYVKRKYPNVDYSVEPAKDALQQRGDVLLFQILGTIQRAFPTIVMTVMSIGYATISIYTVYMSIIIGVRSILDVILNGSIYSTFGEVISLGEYDTLKEAVGKFEVLCYSLISVLFACLLLLFIPFIQLYSKGMVDANYIQPTLAYFLTIATFFAVIRNPLQSMIMAAGHYRKTRAINITQALIAIVGSFSLAKPFGLYGILSGFLISDLFYSIAIVVYVPSKITKTGIRTSIKRIMTNIGAIILVWVSVRFLSAVQVTSYTYWVIYAVGIGFWSLIVTVVLNLLVNKHEMYGLWQMAKGLFQRFGFKSV